MERNQPGNFVKPKLQEVVTWVKNSWEKITDSCIANALRAGYLDKKYSFKDSAIAKHERFGPLILKKNGVLYLVDSFLDAMLKNVGGKPKITNDRLPWIFQLLIAKLSMNMTSFSLYILLVIPDNKFCTIHIPFFLKKN